MLDVVFKTLILFYYLNVNFTDLQRAIINIKIFLMIDEQYKTRKTSSFASNLTVVVECSEIAYPIRRVTGAFIFLILIPNMMMTDH